MQRRAIFSFAFYQKSSVEDELSSSRAAIYNARCPDVAVFNNGMLEGTKGNLGSKVEQ